ncbi:MAG TPA: hypothetical protein VGD24_10050 [Gallionella sp.]
MKHSAPIIVIALLTLAACDKNPADEPFVPPATMPSSTWPSSKPAVALPPGHPSVEPSLELTQQGTVVSSIAVPGFTYIEVKQGNEVRWLTAPEVTVKKGDLIKFDEGSTLDNFKSTTLNRTFTTLTFVNKAQVVKGK